MVKGIWYLAKEFPEKKFTLVGLNDSLKEKLHQTVDLTVFNVESPYIKPQNFYRKSSLVITRGGRNTLSELVYLGIPAITVATACHDFRGAEQRNNIEIAENISNGQIKGWNLEEGYSSLRNLFIAQSKKVIMRSNWIPGNDLAIASINQFLKE